MTNYEVNMNTQPAREMSRPQQTPAERIAWLERWLTNNTHLSYSKSYQQLEAEYVALTRSK